MPVQNLSYSHSSQIGQIIVWMSDDYGCSSLSFVEILDDADVHKYSIITKWFTLAACQCAEDAYWDHQEECLKNTSNLMLSSGCAKDDALYWEMEEN